jgi:hypothetical protein
MSTKESVKMSEEKKFMVHDSNGASGVYNAKSASQAAALAFGDSKFARALEVEVAKVPRTAKFRRADRAVRVKE